MSSALTWRDPRGRRAHNLPRDRQTAIGRADDADVRLDETSVSRRQAVVRFDGTAFRLANLSQTNPTRVNGRPADDEPELHDQDELLLGTLSLRFHDLAARDTISGPVCSHCGRENSATDRDCWFCGTSLVSAASTLRARRRVAGRVIAGDGQFADLYDGQSVVLDGGPPVLRQQAAEGGAMAEITAAGARLTLSGDEAVTVNGSPAMAEPQPLATGDLVGAAGAEYLVIVRD